MGFYVRFDDIRTINEITVQQISKWQEELVALQGAMQKVIGLDSFQGETADSIKTYYNEIHNLLLSAIGSTMVDFMTKIALYWDGYYAIDGDIHTKLNEDTLNKAIKEYDNSLDKLDTSQTSLKTTLDSVSDIFYSIIPAVGTLEYYHDDAKDKIISVRDKVIPYEDGVLNNELTNLRELIENTIAYIREYKNGDRNIMIHYSSGDYMNNESIYNLAVSMNKAQEYQRIHQKDLEEAISQQEKVYEQLQEEYEAEKERLAKERADQGTAQVIMGAFAVGVGFAAIVLTAGAATPVVVTATVTGTCSMAYGLSEVSEGTQHVYYGLNGDPYTSAFNPLRDTVFMGNQEVYSMWGNINMTVAGLCIPVGKSTQGLKGIEAIKAGGKAVAKEIVMDQASELVASYTVPVISDAMNIDSTTGKTLLNLGVQMMTEGALEKGVEAAEVKIETQRIKMEADASGKGLAGLMDEAEAARYEAYWADMDKGSSDIHDIKIDTQNNMDANSITIDDPVRMNDSNIKIDHSSMQNEGEINVDTSKSAEQVIAERTEGMDLEKHPSQYKELSDKKMQDLKQKIDDRTITREEYKQYDWNKRMDQRRSKGVKEFWKQEKQRIENGEPTTRNWTQEQIDDILNGKRPKYNGKTIQGHHAYSVSEYPHLADKGEVIYPATVKEHFEGWHGGSWKNSEPGKPVNDMKEF